MPSEHQSVLKGVAGLPTETLTVNTQITQKQASLQAAAQTSSCKRRAGPGTRTSVRRRSSSWARRSTRARSARRPRRRWRLTRPRSRTHTTPRSYSRLRGAPPRCQERPRVGFAARAVPCDRLGRSSGARGAHKRRAGCRREAAHGSPAAASFRFPVQADRAAEDAACEPHAAAQAAHGVTQRACKVLGALRRLRTLASAAPAHSCGPGAAAGARARLSWPEPPCCTRAPGPCRCSDLGLG
jgi:hypothetical protein